MKLTRGFIQGIMNKDLDERLIPRGQYRDALNIGVSTSAESDVGAVENQLGNTNKSNLSLDPSAKAIGAIADEANFNIYWFVTSDTFDYVFRYNQNTETTIALLQDTKGRVLKFDASYLITGVNIIDDLLFWTDNLNPPRRLNVVRNYATDGFTEDDISVIVKPPLFAPTIRLEDTIQVAGQSNISGEENNMEDSFIEFSYRYKYENDEYSAMAPFSSHAFYPGTYNYNYADWELTSMLNIYNKANIRFHLGGDQVTEIQLLYRESESTNINIIDSFKYAPPYNWDFNDNQQAGAYATVVGGTTAFPGNVAFTTNQVINPTFSNDNIPDIFEVGDEIFIAQTAGFTHSAYEGYHTIVEILDQYTIVIDVLFAGATPVEGGSIAIETKEKEFFNNKIYTVLPTDELGRLFDNVPLKAQAQELIGSRIIYGNYVQFFDLIGANSQPIDVNYALYLETKQVGVSPLPTFRSDRDYEIGIAYLDDYGRMTTVLTSEKNTIYIPPANSSTANDIMVDISNRPPSFANHFRLFIKQSKGNYETVFPLYFYANGGERWFAVGPGDINKVKKDEYIICKTASGVATNNVKKYKVIEVGSYGKDFLNNSDTQEPGVYFRINDYDNLFNIGTQYTHSHVGKGYNVMISLQWYYFLLGTVTENSSGNTISGNMNNLPTVINFPVFYGQSTTANSLIPTASNGFSAHETDFGQNNGQSYRLKIEIEDGPNNKFKYSKMSQNGTETLIQSNVTMLSSIPGNELMDGSKRLANVRFGHLPNQYTTGDYWMMSIHSMYCGSLDDDLGTFDLVDSGTLSESSGPAVAICQGDGWDYNNPSPPYADRPIFAGARIDITIEQKDANGNRVDTPTQTFFSSRDYVNIEEWFWEDQVANKFSQLNFQGGDDGGQRVIFKRGIYVSEIDANNVSSNNPIGSMSSWGGKSTNTMFQVGLYSNPVLSGFSSYSTWGDNIAYAMPVRMCIVQSYGRFATDTGSVGASSFPKIKVEFNIIQSPDITIFETTPDLNPPDIYHELNETFKITNGFHVGNVTTQNAGAPAKISLNTAILANATTEQIENSNFNAYCFGNGLEALRIRSDWNGYPLLYSPRASGVIDDYQQQRVEEALTYSGVYRENTGINNLNEFNLSLGNFKYLDKFFGSIQKLHARDTDLVVFQQNKVSKVLYGKNLLSDSTGGGNIASIPEVLGTQISYAGEYGISDNPESFDYWGNNMFFTDLKRGAVIKLGVEGVIPISSLGMRDFFKDFSLNNALTQKIGAVDPFKEQYVITTNDVQLPCIFEVKPKPSRPFYNDAVVAKSSQDPFNVSSSGGKVCADIIASGDWAISLVDTGDGVSWVSINNQPGSSLIGTGNSTVCFYYEGNSTGVNRSLRIDFSGCSNLISFNSLQSKRRPIQVISHVLGDIKPTINNPVCIDENSDAEANPEYDFTSNPGPPIKLEKIKFKRGTISLRTTTEGLAGEEAIPSPGDTVDLFAAETGTLTQKPFDVNLGNEMRYLVTNVYYTEEQIQEILDASTLLSPVLAAGVYKGSFTYSTPSDESYLYLIWDFTNKVSAGGAIGQNAGSEGSVYANIDYGTAIGRSTIQYNGVTTPNRFRVKYGNTTAIDTGFVAGIGTFDLIKNSSDITKACLIVDTSGVDDGWTIQVGPISLTSFLLDINKDDITTVCPRVPSTTKYHNGINALPETGDTIYDGADGLSKYNGGDALHKIGSGDDYVFVDTEGLVIESGDCSACAEVAPPVLNIPDFNFEVGESVEIKLEASNNPVQWSIVDPCQSYFIKGNSTGGVYSITNCEGEVVEINVAARTNQTLCSLTTPLLITGSDSTFTLSGPCPGSLPKDLMIDLSRGFLKGKIITEGTYRIVVNATNCFGTSADEVFMITVGPYTEFRRFNMDSTTPESNPSDVCAITPTYSIYYHDGDGEYPVTNDFVYYLSDDGAYLPYNGGYLWYLMDNNTAIKIDSIGQVIDTSICGSTKTTEAGDDKTTESDLDKTIE